MSNKSDKLNKSRKKLEHKNALLRSDETQNSSFVNDITKDFDCLKSSILKKASRVSSEFGKVTLGPGADRENGHASDTINEAEIGSNKSQYGTPSSRSAITFSIKKILLENETQRREKVKKAVEQKKLEMEKSQKKIQDELSNLLSKMAIQREKETAEKLAHLEAEEEQLAQRLELDRKNEIQRQRVKESEEILKKIIPFRDNFNAQWKDIAHITKTCQNKESAARLLQLHASRMKDLSLQMETITEKARAGELSAADIKLAEIIVHCNHEILQMFKAIDQLESLYDEEVARREMEVKRAEQAAQEEAQRLKQIQDTENTAQAAQQASLQIQQQDIRQEQSQKIQEMSTKVLQIPQPPQPSAELQFTSEVDSVTPASQTAALQSPPYQPSVAEPPAYPNPPMPNAESSISLQKEVPIENKAEETSEYPDIECQQIYLDSQRITEAVTASYQEFVNSDGMKKFKFECQKTLNITINSISNMNREVLIEKYEKLRMFLSGKGSPNILLNPQAEAYSKNLLAQKIVDQGDTTISCKPRLAFPFAAIAVALWNDWPDFGTLLLARFRTKSPFFVPVFLMPKTGQSEKDYYISLGCKYNENGTPEEPCQFWKRLAGLMYLYASILVTRQRRGVDKPHPHGLGNAWRWLAATLNAEPRCHMADISATLIYTLLEVAGNDLWKTYPNQFPKLLAVLNNNYCEKLKSFDPVLSAPISRLIEFVTKALQTGSIPPPKGQLPPNFW